MRIITKMQAVMRGFLARRKVKAVYGYTMKKGILGRSASIKISPEQLAIQRERVQEVRDSLPEFKYDQPGDDAYAPGSRVE